MILMKKSNHRKVWITTGYNLFAEEGHEGIQIERLSRITGLNKSGFYHYFGDVHEFLKILVKEHDLLVDEFVDQISGIGSYDPGFFDLMLRYKYVCFFHVQLVRNRHVKFFIEAHDRNNMKIDPLVIPLFSKEIGLPLEVVIPYYEALRDTFLTRVDYRTMNYEFLHDLMEQFKTMVPMILNNESGNH